MKRDAFAGADWPSLARYLSGECSAVETRAIESWIAAQPDRRGQVERLRGAWERARDLPSAEEVERALRSVAVRAALEATPQRGGRSFAAPRFTLGATPVRRFSRVVAAAVPIAASVILLVSAWLVWGGPRRGARPGRDAHPSEYATGRAQFATIVLSDGNRVTMGSDSRLTVPEDYGTRTRTVSLEGEASFLVIFDAKQPFRVRTSTATTEDLGTEFMVRAGGDDSVVDVAVSEGQVALLPNAGHGRVVLEAGQAGRVGRSGFVSVTRGVDVGALIRWMTGDLVFHKTPLEEARGALERWYGVNIAFPDSSFAGLPVTASLRGMAADRALERLGSLLDLRYTRHGDVVRFEYRPGRDGRSGT